MTIYNGGKAPEEPKVAAKQPKAPTKAELIAKAEELGIEVPKNAKVAEIEALIEGAGSDEA